MDSGINDLYCIKSFLEAIVIEYFKTSTLFLISCLLHINLTFSEEISNGDIERADKRNEGEGRRKNKNKREKEER